MTNRNLLLPSGIYGITAEKFSCGRSNIQVVEEMIKGGIKVIQYREKRHLKDYCDILSECQTIREMTREHEVTFIINDFVDIALLVDADGVHVGQEDLPVDAVRRLLGPDKIIGLSTHSPEQMHKAQEVGADYIGVGPIYATQTKENVCAPTGFDYLEYVVENVAIPFVAIGGIKQHNIDEVVKRGAQSICLVTEIVGADNITQTVKNLNNAFSA
ncbi:thiamine phosphate synthase [Desulfogranum marinum]|jgi:thiamine-phosphate pyrophosphorylase|uniref:thiamine phosphate synthase n=1 Tax=Desulfogranum marinum TaxID=453220 RepID=UPI001964E06B|nr:thiamine phosphate synthase [Desulfogranum marinum]MBM9511587.1 thiamine phosphate synthase [Desulfogranum marinum]